MSNRPSELRESPRIDRGEYTAMHHHKWMPWVADLFSGRGGVGRVLSQLYPRHMYFGMDIEDYGEEYPGQFVQADLINNPPLNGFSAHVVWMSFPCTAYAEPSPIAYGSREAALEENPRITEEIRDLARENGAHYIIENVPNATRIGDLDANVRVNGHAFGLPFDYERHFETSFECPDAYVSGDSEITIDLRDDQSYEDLAAAKDVPSEWGKQGVRSAMPTQYVLWLLHHCPSVPAPEPTRDQYIFFDAPDPLELAPAGNP